MYVRPGAPFSWRLLDKTLLFNLRSSRGLRTCNSLGCSCLEAAALGEYRKRCTSRSQDWCTGSRGSTAVSPRNVGAQLLLGRLVRWKYRKSNIRTNKRGSAAQVNQLHWKVLIFGHSKVAGTNATQLLCETTRLDSLVVR